MPRIVLFAYYAPFFLSVQEKKEFGFEKLNIWFVGFSLNGLKSFRFTRNFL